MGQVPIMIIGNFELGDLIVPHDEEPNFGKAISIDDASLKDYHRALGTVMSSCSEGNENTISLPLVAIGKK